MKTQKHKRSLRRKSQRSFTLVEVVVAIGLMAYLIIEVVTVQGNSVFFSQYGRNATQATWLAQRVMSNVEYNWNSKPFLDMKTKISEHTFEKYPEYKWSLEIKEWDFPFVKVLTGGLMGGGEDGEEEENPMSKIIESVTDQVFGDEPIFMTAYVEVSWSEGAARDSTSLTYLLTNNSKQLFMTNNIKFLINQIFYAITRDLPNNKGQSTRNIS